MMVFLFLIFLLPAVRCHCPHMAKLNKVEGPSAPAHLPPGDKGWDWDESAAPGSLPQEHFIQTSLVQRALTGEEKSFGLRLEQELKKLQDRLRREARVTVDNENIDCTIDETHYRCSDFPLTGSYHFLVVEDSSSGAAIYSVDRKHNSRSDGAIEMAILDALSRHSTNPLTVYASKEAEKEIGFVRRLSVKEIQNLNAKPTVHVPRKSPLELNLFEAKVLELRSTEGLETVTGSKLTVFSGQEQFEEALKKHSKLAVLFWSNTDSVSVHVFNIFSRLSINFGQTGVLLAHVECHLHSSFCTGLGPRDFRTVVAYRDGENAASTDLLGDEEYYDNWIRLSLNGPLVRLEDETEVATAKKGSLLETVFPAVTVATFDNEGSASFKHYKIAAERLIGRYALTYRIKKGSADAVATFRPMEKRKRVDYEGRFDPASLIQFISTSSEPSVIDISHGFSTDAVFHQPRPILLLEGAEDSFVEKAASSEEIRKHVLVVKNNSPVKIAETLKLESVEPMAILFNKDHASWTQLPESVEKLSKWLKGTESQVLLSRSEIHPLRLLQIASADDAFGKQEIMLLPDQSLFQETREDHPDVAAPATGGCPFMSGGGAAHHEEL